MQSCQLNMNAHQINMKAGIHPYQPSKLGNGTMQATAPGRSGRALRGIFGTRSRARVTRTEVNLNGDGLLDRHCLRPHKCIEQQLLQNVETGDQKETQQSGSQEVIIPSEKAAQSGSLGRNGTFGQRVKRSHKSSPQVATVL